MKKDNRISAAAYGWIYFFVHLAVEIASFYMVFARFGGKPEYILAALLYDCLAFVPQIFIGALADRLPHLKIGAVGGIMMLLGLFLPWEFPALVLISLGNSCLHVEGAERTLRHANGKMTPSALFVAGGSFGVITGQLLAAYPTAGLIVSAFVMAAATLVCFLLPAPAPARENAPLCGFDCDRKKLSTLLLMLLAFITVAARSLASYAIPTSWITETYHKILLFTLMGAGKALGGVLADRFGARRVGLITLIVATPLLCFGDTQIIVSLLGVLFFCMTMPISLGILVSRLDGQPGFAFGITTVGLFCGIFPFFFYQPESVPARILLVGVLSLTAALCFGFTASDDAE